MADIDGHYIDGSGEMYDGALVTASDLFVMRAVDGTLGQTVYFRVSDPTAAAAEYQGPGPLSNIITFKEL